MPLVQTRGAASAQGFGEFAQPAAAVNYVEDVFSTYLYTGNDPTGQTINNGIDLSTKGGLVWLKSRSNATNNNLFDTARGVNNRLFSNTTDAQATLANSLTSFDTTGFTLGSAASGVNTNGNTYCSWTFREQAKFFDIVTFTGNGVTTGRTINHNLGSAPGMMILKVIDLAGDDWYVYHRSIPTSLLALNRTNGTSSPPTTPATIFGNGTITVAPTSTQVTIGGTANSNGYSYVLYLFAHDAGGFGTAGTDNVISCGSFTASVLTTVSLGYEPQYIMIKRTDSTGNWLIQDVMRGMSVTGEEYLLANSAGAAGNDLPYVSPTATGFEFNGTNIGVTSGTYIYMAIRRPMKVPTLGTSVFYPKVHAGSSSYAVGFPTDLCISGDQSGNALNSVVVYRLAGNDQYFGGTASTAAEQTVSVCRFDLQDSFALSYNSNNQARWHFRRAAGYMDAVCYTGTGSNTTQAHNLTVVPELMIVKRRDITSNWAVYHSALGNTKWIVLNRNDPDQTNSAIWNNTTPTSSVFSLGTNGNVNGSAGTFVAYLFATCAGVSKVGSYTGNGGTQAIACGFTGGARFVLIRRTDATSDWYVYDTARGMTLLTDPYLLLNSTAAEAATLGSVTTTTGGFTVDATILAAINTNAASYIFLAIA